MINKSEPTTLSQGETLSFTKSLADFPARMGWSLLYALRGNGQSIEFSSTAPTGDDHVILVAKEVTALWLPAEYQLEGFALNTDGTKERIYLGSISVTPDLSSAAPDLDTRTHAQKMLESIEVQLEKCAQNILLSTTVEGTTIQREQRRELLKLRQSYLQERRGEIALERSKNGKPSQRKIKTVFSITAPGAIGITAFGAGSTNYNSETP